MERDPLTGAPVFRPPAAPARRWRGPALMLGVVAIIGGTVVWWRQRAVAPAPLAPSAVPSAVPAPAEGTDGAAAPAVTGRIIVEVLNASGVRGLGRRATAVLRDRGFDVVYTANAPDTTRRDSTLVLDRAGRAAEAAAVAKALGGARVEARPDTSRYVHVTVLLGGTWRPPANTLYP